MKINTKIKKILKGLGAFFLTIQTKVFALNQTIIPQPAYGVINPNEKIEKIWNFIRFFIVPIIILLGTVIYCKKSKDCKKAKIITVLLTIGFVVILCFITDFILKNVIDWN